MLSCVRTRMLPLLGIVFVVTGAVLSPAFASDVCDVDLVRARAQQSFPDYEVKSVRAESGTVTLLFAKRNGVGTFAIALRASGTRLFTSVMRAQIDEHELATAATALGHWHEDATLQQALVHCSDLAAGESDTAALRGAVEGALADQDRGTRLGPRSITEPIIVVGAFALSLAIVLWPAFPQPRRPTARLPGEWLHLAAVLCAAFVAVGVAVTIAWRMAPEGDEVVTLGSRHTALSTLLSWADGGEPFNPPGAATLFALWLRLVHGLLSARAVSVALIPLTAWLAYLGGRALAGRAVGVAFALLLVMAPAYLRFAVIARNYAMIACALCLILATVGRTNQTPSRGALVGVASLFGLWVSYLLWPLALAAPLLARLQRRDRTRVMLALTIMVVAFVPRVANGFSNATGKRGLFELRTVDEAFAYALAIAGQGPPLGYPDTAMLIRPARAVAVALIAAGIVALWQRDARQLRNALLTLGLVVAPVLALLSGGHGIRDRHVIAVHVALTLLVATGLGLATTVLRSWTARSVAWLLALALATICVLGNRAVVLASNNWIPHLDGLCEQANLVVTVPRAAQGVVFAMLFGDSPEGGKTMRWPPACDLGTEWWCRRVGRVQNVAIDEVTDAVLETAATMPRSVWIFNVDAAASDRIPPRVRRCQETFANSEWLVFDCAATALRP
jgi:hypothetical protein